MPFLAPPAHTEKENLLGYLAMQHDAFRALAHGLTDAQAASAPSASAFSIGTLIRHVTIVQSNWLDGIDYAPEPLPPGLVEGRIEKFDASFGPESSLPAALADFDDACSRLLAAIEAADLDTALPVPNAPWFPQDIEHWSIRWACGHLIQELARHAGHGDIIRETLDGATMYELVAAREEMGDLGFISPWTPPRARLHHRDQHGRLLGLRPRGCACLVRRPARRRAVLRPGSLRRVADRPARPRVGACSMRPTPPSRPPLVELVETPARSSPTGRSRTAQRRTSGCWGWARPSSGRPGTSVAATSVRAWSTRSATCSG